MKLREDLLQIVGEESRISTNEMVLIQHGHGISYHPGKLPDVVVFPVDKEEVRRIVRYANVYRYLCPHFKIA
ncbi:FAD/FMN-containing dehydrogenase [Oikeobacillus pervagus]|uniref:FAD/FMN-containing dehydrogenase n=1 Tax=Oikeobacillus pervagus TaxID=1325931 RepID=A0AAJ1T092_9BACI|nr:hypothetical protein [Oikeobacillus pervagus]MDQ0216139.1 FAD/FMN-containing dehydrogenase [Oikeobacillus pervagus]